MSRDRPVRTTGPPNCERAVTAVTGILVIRFDIAKLEATSGSTAYGPEAWKVVWTALDPVRLEGAILRDGAAADVERQKSVFCVQIEADPAALGDAASALSADHRFCAVAAEPPLSHADAPTDGQFVDAGRVDAGRVAGDGWAAAALHAVRTEAAVAQAAVAQATVAQAAVAQATEAGHPQDPTPPWPPPAYAPTYPVPAYPAQGYPAPAYPTQGYAAAPYVPAVVLPPALPRLLPRSAANVYDPHVDLGDVLTLEQRQNLACHRLTYYPTWLLVVLFFVTLGIFPAVYVSLSFSRLPLVRQGDFRTGMGIGGLFIPVYNFYWLFRFWISLTERINLQFRLRGERPPLSRDLVVATCTVSVAAIVSGWLPAPYLSWILWGVTFCLLTPYLLGRIQSATNDLASRGDC
jgi:hypothetical protein